MTILLQSLYTTQCYYVNLHHSIRLETIRYHKCQLTPHSITMSLQTDLSIFQCLSTLLNNALSFYTTQYYYVKPNHLISLCRYTIQYCFATLCHLILLRHSTPCNITISVYTTQCYYVNLCHLKFKAINIATMSLYTMQCHYITI